jgi:hypothetical protein
MTQDQKHEDKRGALVMLWANQAASDPDFLFDLLDRLTSDWSVDQIDEAYEAEYEGAN